MNHYIICRTCGKHFILDESNKDGRCSDECKKRYRACLNCGKYYIGELEYCSKECGIQYKFESPYA
jgi:hypothetical protein